ncbi:MAG: hypothetical protein GXY38_10500 [Planctomycetes bacterium]|nr:hypothetical protein [Planctomycetota bacterium]
MSYPNRTTADMTAGVLNDRIPPAASGTKTRSATRPVSKFDSTLVEKAMDLVGSFKETDAFDMQLLLTGLSGCIMELWNTAHGSSETHQEILAALERDVRAAAIDGCATSDQVDAWREALICLTQQHLGRTASQIIRRRLRECGSGALSFSE